MKNNNASGFIALSIVLLIFVPLIWFLMDINDIPSKLGMPMGSIPGQWSIILIGYFASVLGAITGFIATAYSVKKSIENQSKIRKIDNAISVLPLVQVRVVSEPEKQCDVSIRCKFDALDIKNKTYTIGCVMDSPRAKILLNNVGQREMYNVRARCIKNGNFLEENEESLLSPIIYKNEGVVVGIEIRTAVSKGFYDSMHELLSTSSKYSSESLIVAIIFDDCFGNTYRQDIKVDVDYTLVRVKKRVYQLFDNSNVKECKTISAPASIK